MQLHDIKKFAFKHFCESLYICNKNSCLNSFTKRFLVVSICGIQHSLVFAHALRSILRIFFIYNNEVKDSSSSDQVV